MQQLADQAAQELIDQVQLCKQNNCSQESIAQLRATLLKWVNHPAFLEGDEAGIMRAELLNQITWLIEDEIIGETIWRFIVSEAKKLGQNDPYNLREEWRISTFELAAEPPEYSPFLEKLFSLAADADTRWAVFSAYENYPWRLRPHAHKYSNGLVSDEDVDNWLIERHLDDDEYLMSR